ncbi:threonine ammonia-lyase [Croceiramulus getboli]|nr:threonine ammonia-lyase [Flavobacteriaceae bacterium YJPT1-3]
METDTTYFPSLADIKAAAERVSEIATVTPLAPNFSYSKRYKADIFFKREDLQQVRSYKIRGAYNKISSLSAEEQERGVICASAGNHAQGVALACARLNIQGTIYMPAPTPKQKVEQVQMFGDTWIDIVLTGDTFDEANHAAQVASETQGSVMVPPFDDEKIIEGQATVGLEMIKQADPPLDYVFVPVGGGGLIAGLSTVFHLLSPSTKIIGVEPHGAPAMKNSLEQGKNISLDQIEKFVDGAAVQRVGDRNFKICQEFVEEVVTVHEGLVCQTILDLYNKEAIVVEPAGALTIAALEHYGDRLEGKRVACVVSGSNNDITRTAEIKERALLYRGLKHYFIIQFPQRAGALKEFVAEILSPQDDITYFEYSKKTSREFAPAVVGIELEDKADLEQLIQRMKHKGFFGEYLNDKPHLFEFLI